MTNARGADLLELVRELDPAAGVAPRVGTDELVASVLAMAEVPDDTSPAAALRPAALRRSRWVLVGAAAAALGVVLAVWPNPESETAVAGWSAVPLRVPADQAEVTADECRAELIAGARDPENPAMEAKKTEGAMRARVALVERRGDYLAVVLDGGEWMGMCVTGPDGIRGSTRIGPRSETATDGVGDVLGGSEVTSQGKPGVAPEDHDPRTGFLDGFLYLAGPVGIDVAALSFDTGASGLPEGPVAATVADGYFGVWWPLAAFPEPGYSDISFTLELRDGSVVGPLPYRDLFS